MKKRKKATVLSKSKTPINNRKQHGYGIALAELFQLLKSVDTTSEDAKLNEVSMSDNNGGRIWF